MSAVCVAWQRCVESDGPCLPRWTVKEAAFKALPNTQLALSWHDAFLTKINQRPTLCHTAQVQTAWRQAGLGDCFPSLHVSITHDGQSVTAMVVAEEAKSDG